MTLIDTHAHLDAAGGIPALSSTPDGQAPTKVIAVTNLPSRFVRLRKISHDRVHWALGLHPGQPHPRTTIDDFIALLPTCTAVGEIGLDSTPTDSPHAVPLDRQRDELDAILNHPETALRLVSIHSRRSVPLVLEHLRNAAIPGGVLHWFTGTPAQARQAADAGAYFSINAKMSRKPDLLTTLPRDRVLLETDAPHTGAHTRPGDVRPVLTMLADAWSITLAEAEEQVIGNQQEILGAVQVTPIGH